MPRVLISGASIAGPTLAYWLVRAGCKVTVVERAASLRKTGQGVDVRDAAREVVKKMGIFDRLREQSSQEEGIRIVDRNDRTLASFGVDESGKGDSPTCDIEILRGELAEILVNLTKEKVSYIFGDEVESLQETDKDIGVTFAKGTPTTAFDLVVAADGIGSKIRSMTFGSDSCRIRSLNSYVSYFSIPPGKTDTMWSRVHWFGGGRVLAVRPDNQGQTRPFFILSAYDKADERLVRLEKATKEGVQAQKAIIQELFQGTDWETDRVLKGMQESDDFYMQHVAQVKLDRWSSGRVTVLGDAGYAPSPFTGMGTSLAFLAAYVLAGEISKQPDNLPAALESYERVLRPHVESVQNVLPGVPWIFNPQSQLGVRVIENIFWTVGIISKTRLAGFFTNILGLLPLGDDDFRLPEYEAFKE